jgi:Uma2 family endonuclease
MSHALAEPEPTQPPLTLVRGPYTVDDLYDLPYLEMNGYEVLGGWIHVSPSAGHEHQDVIAQLVRLFWRLLPPGVDAKWNLDVSLPYGDCAIPDLFVTTATKHDSPDWIPAQLVHTVVEVVSPSNSWRDRHDKWLLYAQAGIPCYWRMERWPWPGYRGPVPALVVGLLRNGAWDETVYAAGAVADIPLVFGRGAGDVTVVKLDPAALLLGD